MDKKRVEEFLKRFYANLIQRGVPDKSARLIVEAHRVAASHGLLKGKARDHLVRDKKTGAPILIRTGFEDEGHFDARLRTLDEAKAKGFKESEITIEELPGTDFVGV